MKKTQGSLDSFLSGKAYSTKKTQLKIIPKFPKSPKKNKKLILSHLTPLLKKAQKNHKNEKIRQKTSFPFQKRNQKNK